MVDSCEMTIDCSAVKHTSLSWSTVHSAPAVLGRFARHKQQVRWPDAVRADRRRDEIYFRHSPCCHYAYPAATAAAVADDDGDGQLYGRRVSPSLHVARPVLAETQYWV